MKSSERVEYLLRFFRCQTKHFLYDMHATITVGSTYETEKYVKNSTEECDINASTAGHSCLSLRATVNRSLALLHTETCASLLTGSHYTGFKTCGHFDGKLGNAL
jgi:hypothetical protein